MKLMSKCILTDDSYTNVISCEHRRLLRIICCFMQIEIKFLIICEAAGVM